MARRIHRTPRRRVDLSELSDDLERLLLVGFSYFERFADEAEHRAAWRMHRERLLAGWIAEHPGTRPAGWWRFDSPGRRKRVDGLPHPHDDYLRRLDDAARRGFALPAPRDFDLACGIPRHWHPDDGPARYETEPAFLERFGLLADDERQRLVELQLLTSENTN